MTRRWWGSLLAGLAGLGCGSPEQSRPPATWEVVNQNEGAALLSVSGTAANDVWLVGADDGEGPLVLHGDGRSWQREATGVRADLWWVQALPSGLVYAGGSEGTLLEYQAGTWAQRSTPGTSEHTVFGVWAASERDVYAVGSAAGQRGFLWHSAGGAFEELPLPSGLPLDEHGDPPALFKVWGASESDVWAVGDRGVVLRGSALGGFRRIASGSEEERLFTVQGAGGRVAMVGGSANGWALEPEGERLIDVTPPGSAPLQGVCWSPDGALWAVGVGGNVYVRDAEGAAWRDVFTRQPVQSLHAVWVDPSGGVWAVGGNVLTPELDRGVALHYAAALD